jgi:hypothetical protein
MVMSFPGHGLENAPSLASGAFLVVELKTIAMRMQAQANTHGAFNAFFLVAEKTSISKRKSAPETSKQLHGSSDV